MLQNLTELLRVRKLTQNTNGFLGVYFILFEAEFLFVVIEDGLFNNHTAAVGSSDWREDESEDNKTSHFLGEVDSLRETKLRQKLEGDFAVSWFDGVVLKEGWGVTDFELARCWVDYKLPRL